MKRLGKVGRYGVARDSNVASPLDEPRTPRIRCGGVSANTLYILTDMRYLPEQWLAMTTVGKLGLAVQYIPYELIGLTSFLLALYPLEKTLTLSRWREHNVVLAVLLITVNFFIGFGIVLGRVQRLNSWDIFLDAPKVIHASFHIVSSWDLLLLAVLCGVLANAVYFLFRKYRGVSAALVSKWR
jgi:uncharacterized membrane protein